MKFSSFIYSATFALIIMSSCSSDDSSENISNGRHQRMLTITQNEVESSSQAKIKVIESEWGSENENSVNGPRKSILVDQGDAGIKATWEMGDEMTVYNKSYPSAGYAIVKATSTAKNTTFIGAVNCQVDDVIRLFYPAVSENGSVTDPSNTGTLTLDISSQKGTLEDIQQNYDFNYGQATVTAVTTETATANAESTENLIAICKFNFKYDNQYLKQIKKVVISGVAPTATYTLGARNTPSLSPDANASVTIKNDGLDNCVYVALFPGAATPTFTITTKSGTFKGALSTATLAGGKYYNVTINMTKSEGEYVEVCGIKWAKGNLIYDPVNGGDEGFVENWKIAPSQWYLVNPSANSYTTYLNNEIKDVFINGYLGEESFSNSVDLGSVKYFVPSSSAGVIDISMKYFYANGKEINESNLVDDREHANRGDLAYWASYGEFRLPRLADFQLLLNEASYQYGYIKDNNTNIYGFLFWTPDDERVTNISAIEFDESELEKGLFLPKLNCYREYASSGITHGGCYTLHYPNSTICQINTIGLYSISNDNAHRTLIRPILCD